MSDRRPAYEDDIQKLTRRLLQAGLALFVVLAIGAVGYRLIAPDTSWVDAVYMTFITLTTVGFGEIVDLSGNPAGRIFTMGLLMAGIGIAAYLASTATGMILEGHLRQAFWRHRMHKEAARMTGHQIVCGSDETALQAARELGAVGARTVLVCEDAQRAEHVRERLPEVTLLIGDAADEAVLRAANIEHARGLVACSDDDKDNLVVTLTARNLNRGLRIISRATLPEMGAKMTQVGADAVVNASVIGGLRMASELVRPTVVTFLDKMLRDRERNLRVSEVTVSDGIPAVGRTLEEVRPVAGTTSLVLACREPDGRWTYNPEPGYVLVAGTTLIVMGSPQDVAVIDGNLRGTQPAAASPQ